MTPCSFQQSLEVGEQTEEPYDFFDDALVSRAGRAGENDRICLRSTLYALTSKVRAYGRHAQTRSMLCLKAQSAREAAELAASRKVVKENTGNGSSLSSAFEKSAVVGRRGGRKKVRKKR